MTGISVLSSSKGNGGANHHQTGSGITSQDALRSAAALHDVPPSISAHEIVVSANRSSSKNQYARDNKAVTDEVGDSASHHQYSLEVLREKHAKMKETTTASQFMMLNKDQSQSTIGCGDFSANIA